MWGGSQKGSPHNHDSTEKLEHLSYVDVFHYQIGLWEQKSTRGTPLGAEGYACVALGDNIYFFGGYCGHYGCYHNSVHKLATFSLEWSLLAPTEAQDSAPMKKSGSGMVGFSIKKEDLLFIVGGSSGSEPSFPQPGAMYEKTVYGPTHTNEQHIFSLSTSKLHFYCL